MEKYFNAYYYDNNNGEIISTKDIFSDYQSSNDFSTFPEYMEEELSNGNLTTLDSYKDVIFDNMSYYLDRIEYHIDEMRRSLDDLEDLLEHEDENDLKWEMVEVLE